MAAGSTLFPVDVQTLPTGLYAIELATPEGQRLATVRLVVER
jgi:hypothetical protein